jgi:hypothetical protein
LTIPSGFVAGLDVPALLAYLARVEPCRRLGLNADLSRIVEPMSKLAIVAVIFLV